MRHARLRHLLIILVVLTAVFMLGSTLQQRLGISFSLEGLERFREWVQSLGWVGPVVYVLLFVFRIFIGLSSHLVLILGGMVFGVAGGILWGSVGLLISALMLFYLARMLGKEWVERRFGSRYKDMLARVKRLGPVAIFVATAHPLGLLTPVHLAGGLVGMDVRQFTIAVALAAPIRAIPYAILGTAVLDLSLGQSLAITAGLFLTFALPLLNPRVRAWVLGAAPGSDK